MFGRNESHLGRHLPRRKLLRKKSCPHREESSFIDLFINTSVGSNRTSVRRRITSLVLSFYVITYNHYTVLINISMFNILVIKSQNFGLSLRRI